MGLENRASTPTHATPPTLHRAHSCAWLPVTDIPEQREHISERTREATPRCPFCAADARAHEQHPHDVPVPASSHLQPRTSAPRGVLADEVFPPACHRAIARPHARSRLLLQNIAFLAHVERSQTVALTQRFTSAPQIKHRVPALSMSTTAAADSKPLDEKSGESMMVSKEIQHEFVLYKEKK